MQKIDFKLLLFCFLGGAETFFMCVILLPFFLILVAVG